MLSFPIAGERNCVTTVEIISKGEREKWILFVSQSCTFAAALYFQLSACTKLTGRRVVNSIFRDNFPRKYVQAPKGRPSSQLKRRTRGT